jgi:Copper fist DNA binding domain
MIIDGEKWACDSCVKGHRVSNCNHAGMVATPEEFCRGQLTDVVPLDRPLNHIAPKGRPVKQCEHCRDARKSKSHHAKCDCGSKRKDKKQSESKSEPLPPPD